jgi:hypothetical protein
MLDGNLNLLTLVVGMCSGTLALPSTRDDYDITPGELHLTAANLSVDIDAEHTLHSLEPVSRSALDRTKHQTCVHLWAEEKHLFWHGPVACVTTRATIAPRKQPFIWQGISGSGPVTHVKSITHPVLQSVIKSNPAAPQSAVPRRQKPPFIL